MSNAATPAAPPPATPPAPAGPKQIRIISHSSLYYWWPVWFFGFVFAFWTYIDGDRMAIVPGNSVISKNEQGEYIIKVGALKPDDRLLKDANDIGVDTKQPKPRVTSNSAVGPLFLIILLLVIVITNVPLRGLWSLVVIFMVIAMALLFTVLGWWERILDKFGDLHVFMNLSGYLFLSTVLFVCWFVTVILFDSRTYMIFTPGQMKVCEEIGGREKVYDTTGISIEKQRDDWFRHIILGFGTGDITVKTSGADRHEIRMPNVILIGYKIAQVEALIRERTTKAAG